LSNFRPSIEQQIQAAVDASRQSLPYDDTTRPSLMISVGSIPAPRKESIVPELVAGAISGTLIVTFGISLAALIFTGDLSRYVPAGIGVVLFSSFVIGATVSIRGSFKPVISAPQENTSVILALMASAVGQKLPAGVDALPTILACFALASIATGALFGILGQLRLGKIVHYIPSPVVGGFLAGTGWLLVQGSLSVLVGVTITSDNSGSLFAPGAPLLWIPGVIFGIILTVMLRRKHHFLTLPGLLVGAIAVFYLAIWIGGMSVEAAGTRGFLLGHFPQGGLWPPLRPSALGQIDWSVVRSTSGSIAALTVLAAISILLNASGLELASEQEIDLDRELRATGLANILSGLFGGVVGYLSLSESTLNYKLGARKRIPGLISAALCLLAIFAGSTVLAYFPKPVLGGLLLYMGLSFLVENLYDAWLRLPILEYGLVLVILLAVVAMGFIAGVGAGLLISAVLFAVSYARINVVKNATSGAVLRSKAARSPAKQAILTRRGDRIQVLQLQGYIFFGTAYALMKVVQQHTVGRGPMTTPFVVIDFRNVHGLDSSAVVAFTRMRRLAAAEQATLAFTDLPPGVARQLARGVIDPASARPPPEPVPRADRPTIAVFEDLDRGLEWCETQLLGRYDVARERVSEPERAIVDRLAAYLERIDAPLGYELYNVGDLADDLFLIESGEVAAWLEAPDGRSKRLRTMGPGGVVGEAGVYLKQPRSATVRAMRDSVLHRLTVPSLERMTSDAPELAALLHRHVARVLSERMVEATNAELREFY
jgi:SulP family sulfate permease